MTVFVAKIANLIGWGEVSTRRGKGGMRNKFKLRLMAHAAEHATPARAWPRLW
jgi:hypothetical protein